ncbi:MULTISPECIES: BREX system serine/threonine kinase PglW [Thiorhodovibrio]|uniref:BREX system serine/threonine kinase PglW n=1 Tax=Thiorhodovibrio TaxID=61593 RepID=UPI001911F905|nr:MULTISPECIES: BREX system serine/threonine kinase PglW [Thiorhodovibrio]MBK5968538.1 serine/threonine protein kinase [Thiorhodovibrio winogradskyi]WPL12428.1 Serine/threonine-protein kinase PknF [Thiorhodovibrio litoralis]
MNKLWKQITPSDFAWEREALDWLKRRLPDHEPYRAWANFEFIAQDGSINEVDVLILTPKGLFLVEIKSHPGEILGDAGTWVWHHAGRRRVFDNPRLLADRKAKKLKSLLECQRSTLVGSKQGKARLPFVDTLVFLSAESVVNKLQGPARLNVHTRKTVMDALCRMDHDWKHRKLDRPSSKSVARALEEAGIKESMRARRVGLYELGALLDEADHFQDWLATHAETGVQRRIRIYLTLGRPEPEAATLRQAAKLEHRLLEGIEHPGILQAREYQQHDQGPALLYEYDPAALRLDHFLTERGAGQPLDTQDALALLRQIAEAVRFAHGKRLYHRALSPQSIFVRHEDAGTLSARIANWATARRALSSETQTRAQTRPQTRLALSHLSGLVQEEAGPYLALEAHAEALGGAASDSVYLDVFSLGAIAYLLFTGQPPAANDLELQDKLSSGTGLQVTDALNGACTELQYLIQYATHPDTSSRSGSVDEFLDNLTAVEDELTRPDSERRSDPAAARPGDTFEGGIRVLKRLGRGASSVAFVVDHQGQQRVLKLAATPEHNARLRQEGEILGKLRHQAIIACHATQDFLGHTGLLLDQAAEGTLAERLRALGPIQLELLERFGEDLLSALGHLEEKGLSHRDIKPANIGLTKQGRQLHLVLFDFSLAGISPENFTAGTLAYMDPFLRDPGRRRWDDYAERFAAALTLYEMATGRLPNWAETDGLPPLIEGALEIDPAVFDPSVRDGLADFFRTALARDVKRRFGNAEDMRRAWLQLFHQAARAGTRQPAGEQPSPRCPISEAQLDTQIGLLPLSAQALDTLSRLNINRVAELIRLPRNELVRMTGVGTKTRRELSELIASLQARLASVGAPTQSGRPDSPGITTVSTPAAGPAGPAALGAAGLAISVDQLMRALRPAPTKASDPDRQRFLAEYLGRLDGDSAGPADQIPADRVQTDNLHWPTSLMVAATLGMASDAARELQARLLTQWGKNKFITQLRHDIAQLLVDQGGVMTAVELAEAVLLRRGSVQPSPTRERWARAVVRAAVETELARSTRQQAPRWVLRRCGKRVLIAEDTQGQGEALADYAEALGQLADECAEQRPLLSPARALERIRSLPAPESVAALSNHRLLRLAVAASQDAALSSRAEFYPKGMPAERSLELAKGALLGSPRLSVADVQDRIQGRYPQAQPLPGRPQLDSLLQGLDLGLVWHPQAEHAGQRGCYCLPQVGTLGIGGSTFATTRSSIHYTQHEGDESAADRELKQFEHSVRNALESARFLALSVRPRLWLRAQRQLAKTFGLEILSFDALLLRHLRILCDGMANPPNWQVVLKADAADSGSIDWSRLQSLVRRVLPAMADELKTTARPVLLTDTGLIARYGLIDTWLADLRRHLHDDPHTQALLLLIANDTATPGAILEGVSIPSGAGSREFARLPSAWLQSMAVEA